MEKIKEALRKAKDSATQIAQTRNVEVTNRALREEFAHQTATTTTHEFNNNLEQDLDNIVYGATRSVQLDSATLEKNRIVCVSKTDSAAWVFDSLRTQVLQKMEENGWTTLAVVSPNPESGKTVVATNLAIAIASQPDRTAMLVDFDFRRPKIAQYLGIKLEKSLNDYIANNTPISEVMINPDIQKLVILPTKNGIANSAEVLSSRKIQSLINEIKARYAGRIVVFDLPPLLNADDALIMIPKVDCILMVIGNGHSKESEIEEALHYIPKEKLLGVVLNKAEIDVNSYY